MYQRSLRAPTKENSLVLTAVDIEGKNTQEKDQIRVWDAPTAGPEISTVLEGILARCELWLSGRERTLTAVTQEKHLLFLCLDLFYRFCWISFSFFPSLLPPPLLCCSCRIYWNYEIQLSFWAFSVFSSVTFFIVVINICLYIGLLQFCRVFLFFSFLFFFNFNFLNLLLFFLHVFLCLLFLLFFPPCS